MRRIGAQRLALLALTTGCGFHVPATAPPDDGVAADASVDARDLGIDARACPSGFAVIAGAPSTSRYRIFVQQQAYPDAVTTCANLGTHLIKLDTQGEADALEQAIDAAATGVDTHIYRVVGRRNRVPDPDTWVGLDGVTPLTFLPWGQGEPTNQVGEDCMSLRKETGNPALRVTGADLCTTLHEYACECE